MTTPSYIGDDIRDFIRSRKHFDWEDKHCRRRTFNDIAGADMLALRVWAALSPNRLPKFDRHQTQTDRHPTQTVTMNADVLLLLTKLRR